MKSEEVEVTREKRINGRRRIRSGAESTTLFTLHYSLNLSSLLLFAQDFWEVRGNSEE